MVIPSLEPSHEANSRNGYGAIPFDSIEDGSYGDEDDRKFRSPYPHPHQRSIIEPQDGEVIDEVSIIANTINALLGVSLFSMPWGFQQAGMMGGMVILIIVGYLSYDTARMLLVAQKVYHHRTGEVQGYPEIAALSMGPRWASLVQAATIISCLGGCTGYLIFFGESVGQALSMEPSTVLYISIVPLVLLSWTRSFRELTVFTVFGVIALVIAVLAILLDGSQKMDRDYSDVSMVKDSTIVNFVGPATFLFCIHYTVLSLGAENLRMHTAIALVDESIHMETKSALVTPVAWSYGLSVVLIGILGAAGFVMYRNVDFVRNPDGDMLAGCEDHVCQNVLLNLSPGLKRNIVGMTMSVVIILSYVLNFAPAREHVESMFLNWLRPSSARIEYWAQNGLRTCLVLLTVAIALKCPYSASMLGAVGGLTDALQSFVLPPLIFLNVSGLNLTANQRAYNMLIILWGSITILYTIVYNISVFIF